ncbi:MAG: D-alanyl-D-alanine carboxypeptidase [Nocardiopsaceae bacterium]|nr:D-alanyl-D-alanine carboxypeptidase [Nocardiopsaceae bacterium]
MRLSRRRKKIGALAAGLATGLSVGLAAGCSAAPGAAYAGGGAHQVKPLATAKANVAPDRWVPTGPLLAVAGAPAGVAAKGGVLANAATGQVLWSRQAGVQRPMASITKVMTAYLVVASGDLNRAIRVPKAVINYVAKNGAESDGLHPGETLTAQQLLSGLLVQSGADAAYTLANAYGPGLNGFIAKMNATAKKLGMNHTHFTSPDGLPYPTETSTYSTPQDLLTLGNAAMRSATFTSIVEQIQYHLPKGKGHLEHWWYNDDSLLRTYRGAVGIKTGFTDQAGHCLLFEAVRDGRSLLGVVLDSPATGVRASENDATRILNWGFSLKQAS